LPLIPRGSSNVPGLLQGLFACQQIRPQSPPSAPKAGVPKATGKAA
jgi:hypothetical protein